MVSTPSRRKLASHDFRTYSALPFTPRTFGLLGSRTIPNFVARTIWPRLPLDRPTDQLFVRVRPVDIRRVEKVDAQFQRPMNRRDGFLIVTPAIKFRHPHAPQPLGRDLKTTA